MEFNGTFLATIITFILFVFVMNKVLYAPILGIMEARKNFIDSNYKDANDNDAKSAELVAEKEEKLSDAKEQARGEYIAALEGYKAQKAEVIINAQNSAQTELEASKAELENLSNEVKEGLKSSMNDLANDIVEKIIGYRSEVEGFDDTKISEVLWGQNS